jgi:hypothetical protein
VQVCGGLHRKIWRVLEGYSSYPIYARFVIQFFFGWIDEQSQNTSMNASRGTETTKECLDSDEERE